ncbi:MAG: carbohydrate ABC transporter permease [Saccharofermentanales bacterium]
MNKSGHLARPKSLPGVHEFAGKVWKGRKAYLYLSPMFIGLIIFCYYPPISGIIRSFFDWDGIGHAEFIGLGNFKELFSDRIFLDSIGTMFLLLIPRLIIGISVPFIMSELIFAVRSKKLQSAYRIMVLLPIVAPGIVGLLIWKYVYDPNIGLMSALLKLLHIIPADALINYLGDVKLVIPAIIFMGFPWIGGTSVLIYMSGLMNISGEVLESASLDGAGMLKRIYYIDIPLLMGQFRYFIIFGIIGGLQDYGVQLVLTQGGPGYSTFVPGFYMYNEAFVAGRMGYACSIGTSLFVVIFFISLIAFRYIRTSSDVTVN